MSSEFKTIFTGYISVIRNFFEVQCLNNKEHGKPHHLSRPRPTWNKKKSSIIMLPAQINESRLLFLAYSS